MLGLSHNSGAAQRITMPWQAKWVCGPRAAVERIANSSPQRQLFPPSTGDLCDSLKPYNRRLRAFGFCQTFNIARNGEDTKGNLNYRFSFYTTAR